MTMAESFNWPEVESCVAAVTHDSQYSRFDHLNFTPPSELQASPLNMKSFKVFVPGELISKALLTTNIDWQHQNSPTIKTSQRFTQQQRN